MSRLEELTANYEEFMVSPRPGREVCETCFNFTHGYQRCYSCTRSREWLDAMLPISYSIAHEQLHHALALYKRPGVADAELTSLELAAVLWRFLGEHEECLARAAGVPKFALVTTVPPTRREREHAHPLNRIVGELVEITKNRYVPLVRRSDAELRPRVVTPERYAVGARLDGDAVLLIDDTWTTGSSARSAAAALKSAGCSRVAALVIGRHLNREWRENDRRLRGIRQPFDWRHCALCAPAQA